jgi:hypothetical protein
MFSKQFEYLVRHEDGVVRKGTLGLPWRRSAGTFLSGSVSGERGAKPFGILKRICDLAPSEGAA